MKIRPTTLLATLLLLGAPAAGQQVAREIPLPEHPRPDHQRPDWVNLNGEWDFQFDPGNSGDGAGWARGGLPQPRKITVPFGWGSALSGVPDSADIGWYQRTVTVPREWDGKRVFLVVGASDWHTSAWLDGQPLGTGQAQGISRWHV